MDIPKTISFALNLTVDPLTLGAILSVAILRALVEGNSLRSTSRMFDVSINTVTKLLVDAGKVASKDQDSKKQASFLGVPT